MRRRLQKACASAAIFLLAVGIFPNVVFCVGDNGHQAIEFASQACCHPKAAQGSDCVGPGDHCASKCNDVRLGVDAMLSKSNGEDLARNGITQVSAVALVSAALLPVSPAGTISRQGLASTLYFPAPRERHTTVQLC